MEDYIEVQVSSADRQLEGGRVVHPQGGRNLSPDSLRRRSGECHLIYCRFRRPRTETNKSIRITHLAFGTKSRISPMHRSPGRKAGPQQEITWACVDAFTKFPREGRQYDFSMLHLVYRKESNLVLVCREQRPEASVLQFLLNGRGYRTFSVCVCNSPVSRKGALSGARRTSDRP